MKLDSPTARKRLAPRHAVYWNNLSRGYSLGYRRSDAAKAGIWYLKFNPAKDTARDAEGECRRVQQTLAAADDYLPADGLTCLSYEQVRKKAAEWFSCALHRSTGQVKQDRDYTVENACADYLRSMEGRSRSMYATTTIQWVLGAKRIATRRL